MFVLMEYKEMGRKILVFDSFAIKKIFRDKIKV